MPPGPSAVLGFPRSRRIKQGRDFDRARARGRRVVEGCMIVNWLPSPAGVLTRLGVITSRKLGNAVVRSRARRLLRECYRLHQLDLAQPIELVLVARSSIVGRSFGEVEHDFMKALRRAKLVAASSGASSTA